MEIITYTTSNKQDGQQQSSSPLHEFMRYFTPYISTLLIEITATSTTASLASLAPSPLTATDATGAASTEVPISSTAAASSVYEHIGYLPGLTHILSLYTQSNTSPGTQVSTSVPGGEGLSGTGTPDRDLISRFMWETFTRSLPWIEVELATYEQQSRVNNEYQIMTEYYKMHSNNTPYTPYNTLSNGRQETLHNSTVPSPTTSTSLFPFEFHLHYEKLLAWVAFFRALMMYILSTDVTCVTAADVASSYLIEWEVHIARAVRNLLLMILRCVV